jgi:hypothetical protein
MLREVHKTGHHPRWEHILLQCYLFNQASQGNRNLSLKTKVTLSDGTEVSSVEELLKCWVFLLNFGHIHGTLEAERFWMDLFLSDDDLKLRLLQGLPDDRSREFATHTLETENFYQLHELFALFLLGRYKREARHRGLPMETWILMIEDYMGEQPDGSTLGRAKDIFHVIRRCSYVYLDVTYSASPIRIQPAVLLQTIRNISLSDLRDPDSTFNRLLKSINDVLFETIYASPEAVAFKQHYFEAQKDRYGKILAKQGPEYLSKNLNTLFVRLKEKRESDFGNVPNQAKYKSYLRLRFLPEEFWSRTPTRYFTETHRLNNKGESNYKFFVTPIPHENLAGSVLDVLTSMNPIRLAEAATIFWTCLGYCVECYSEWENTSESLFRDLCHKPLPALFLKILGLFLPPDFNPRFRDGSSPDQTHVYLITQSREVAGWCRSFRKTILECELKDDRKRELRCLRQVLRKSPPFKGYGLITGSNVIVYKSDGTMVAEIDGIIINVRRRGFHLWLCETKRGVSTESKSEASRSLDSKLSVLLMEQRLRTTGKYRWGVKRAQASVAFWEGESKQQKVNLV